MKRISFAILLALSAVCAFSQTIHKDTFLIKSIDIEADVVFEKHPTALKTMEPLKHIPITVSTVNHKQIEERAVNNLNEALRYTTGVRPTINYGGFQTFRFRGFGQPVIMVDGARDERMNWSSSAPVTSLTAVESIEFLKGPASVVYGHSAVGGILNIVRKQPTEETTGNARVGYGAWNKKRMNLGAGGAIASPLTYRFDAGYADSDGWRDNKTNTANAYLALDWQLNDNNVIKFKAGANDDFYATEAGMPAVTNDIFDATTNKQVYEIGDLPAGFKREQRYNDPSDYLTHTNYNIALAWEHTFGAVTRLVTGISYNDDDIDYFSTEELSYLTSNESIYDHYYLSGDNKKYICLDSLQRTFPLRFSHKTKTLQYNADVYHEFTTGGLKHSFVGGYSLLYLDRVSYTGYNVGQDVYGDGLFAKVSVVDPVLNQGYLKTKFSGARVMSDASHGLYFQDVIDVMPQLKAMLGGRFDLYKYNYQRATVTNGLDYEFNPDSPEQSITNKAFSYRAGLVYLPYEDLSIYASASSFFKPYRSVFNSNYIYIDKNGEEFQPEEGEEVYEPQQGYQLEGGIKWELGARLNVNASSYYILKESIVQYLEKTEAGKQVYGQVGAVDSKGFELDVIAYPFKGMSVNAGYSYNETRYRAFANNPYMSDYSYEGNALTHTPENQFFAWANYTVQSGLLKNLSIGGGTRYTDDVFTNASNAIVLPAYWVSDATVAYTLDNVTLRLNANNIADEYYFDNTVYSAQYVPGMGRSFEASMSINF
ncbi:TonB-dependent receptor [Carboxylicivirga taeanensis]|uniref:TonB-dependent receptor n=1 Tax=Carboxylicivirga taeanensis TaxID=1416875 RepID=UPI003F6E30EA